MPLTLQRSLAFVVLATTLLLIAPLPAAGAVPADDGPATLSVLTDWAHWLTGDWLRAATAYLAASPDLDPDGLQATPPGGHAPPVDGATSTSEGNGEASPNLDPNE